MEVLAHAKVNLCLEVLGRRSDGYHEVTTVFQAIDLADRLRVESARRLEFDCSLPELAGEDNLVWRAAQALRSATGCSNGAALYLEKHIPVAMGLGGGSSDAAAALVALNAHWELGLDGTQLQSIAAGLGSDVPFFLHAFSLHGGTALGTGRGEVIQPLPPLPPHRMVLACPSRPEPGPPKTALLYSLLTPDHYTDGARTDRLVASLKAGRLDPSMLYNAFEQVASMAFGEYESVRRQMEEAVSSFPPHISGVGRDSPGPRGIHLSGSGPALYAFMSGAEEEGSVLGYLKALGVESYGVGTYLSNVIHSTSEQ